MTDFNRLLWSSVSLNLTRGGKEEENGGRGDQRGDIPPGKHTKPDQTSVQSETEPYKLNAEVVFEISTLTFAVNLTSAACFHKVCSGLQQHFVEAVSCFSSAS